jgi:hypothetical protein
MNKDSYNDKLKNLLEITDNSWKSVYRKNLKIVDIDTDTITVFDNFGARGMESEGKEVDSDGFVVHYSFGDQKKIKDVVYRINTNGFRTHNFKENTDEKKIVLASGCSFTFGLGLPEKYSWPKILEDRLNENSNEYLVYNLGWPGSGYFLTIKNIFSFIKKYGNPHSIFISFPNLNRDVYYSKIEKKFKAQVVNISYVFKGNADMKDFVINYDEGGNLIKTVSYMNALEMFCNTNNIKLYWTTWCPVEADLMQDINFDNYFRSEKTLWNRLTNKKEAKNNKDYKDSLPDKFLKFWEIAGDKSHPGISWSYEQADMFFKLYNDDLSDIIDTNL